MSVLKQLSSYSPSLDVFNKLGLTEAKHYLSLHLPAAFRIWFKFTWKDCNAMLPVRLLWYVQTTNSWQVLFLLAGHKMVIEWSFYGHKSCNIAYFNANNTETMTAVQICRQYIIRTLTSDHPIPSHLVFQTPPKCWPASLNIFLLLTCQHSSQIHKNKVYNLLFDSFNMDRVRALKHFCGDINEPVFT